VGKLHRYPPLESRGDIVTIGLLLVVDILLAPVAIIGLLFWLKWYDTHNRHRAYGQRGNVPAPARQAKTISFGRTD
jgi:hypothetical protein